LNLSSLKEIFSGGSDDNYRLVYIWPATSEEFLSFIQNVGGQRGFAIGAANITT
jgi:hypothetical protein